MKPEQLEIETLRREVAKLKAERECRLSKVEARSGPALVRCRADGLRLVLQLSKQQLVSQLAAFRLIKQIVVGLE